MIMSSSGFGIREAPAAFLIARGRSRSPVMAVASASMLQTDSLQQFS
jgi:hypothetical protein